MLRKFLINYALRHQHPLNQVLHVIGLPVTFAVPVYCLIEGRPGWALAAFVLGYGLQFAGHAV
ncbi:MAG: DUF962 domain-containing protein, partial [Planctomycetaceae bacterium]|nr:DUF962 domain-containing protein [Planctomycetaceae bacterium]